MNLWRGLIGLLATAATGLAMAETEVRELEAFDRVAFAVPGQLTLRRGDGHQVTLEAAAEDLERIETRVSDGTLELAWNSEWGFWNRGPEGDIEVRVVLPVLAGVALDGSGSIDAGSWRCDALTAELRGSGDLRFAELDAETLTLTVSGSGDAAVERLHGARARVRINGSGDVTLAGVVDVQDIDVRGSGDVDAAGLEGSEVAVEILGSGDARVWATRRLSAQVRGSGNIGYRGAPEVRLRQQGSGTVGPL